MIRRVLTSALKQAVLISIAVVTVALVFNAARKDGVPLVADAETFRVQTDAEFMKVEDARRLFDEGTAIFVDARDPRIFSIQRVEGAVNVPPTGAGPQDIGWLADAAPSIVCYASEKSQRQAGVVADRLLEIGAKRVFVLYGGFEAWRAAGLPTESG